VSVPAASSDGVQPGCVPWPEPLAARWRAAGYWRGETFPGMLRERAARHPDRIAIVAGAERWSYAELDARADALATGFAGLGLAAGDRVVVQLGNVAAFAEVVFALFRLGALPVFALPSHRHRELGHFCQITGAAAYVGGALEGRADPRELAATVRAGAPELRHVVVLGEGGGEDCAPLDALRADAARVDRAALDAGAPLPSAFAFLQLSGGSTGLPKLIPRTHDEYLYTLHRSAELCGLGPASVYLAALPVAHNYPLSSPGIMGALHAGARVVLAPDPSPSTCFPLIRAERVTITGLVPPLAMLWLDAATGDGLPSLEVLQVGGAKLTEAVARRVRPTLGCTLQQVFGMAEGLVCYTRLDDDEERIVTTQGRPMAADDELRVVDEEDAVLPPDATGSLQTRGPYTIQGYYRAAEHNARAFTADGWYRTGDIVRLTAAGDVVVEGRDKDQINRGGEKIAAAEVENELLAHPAVHDVAVVAVPDALLGEKSCAFVVPRGAPPRAPELRRFVAGRGLAAFKIPDRFVFVDTLPRTPVGKVSKVRLRALAAEAAARPAPTP
jgi:2,3-dihydroxybenzoate-AMP ligase